MYQKKGFWKELWEYKLLLIMLAPAIIYFIVFNYIPMGGLVLAFKKYDFSLGMFRSPWVGFDNFEFLFKSGKLVTLFLNASRAVSLHLHGIVRNFLTKGCDLHMAQFTATAEYYSTAFHELTHSTGHQSRLNRLEKVAFFGMEAYSKEELVAEIGAAALVNHAGLETFRSLRNSVAYIQNWLTVLKNDKRFIVSASGKAEKAVNLILGSAE